MKNQKNVSGVDVDALLAVDPNVTPPAAMSEAMEEFRKREAEKAKVEAVNRLSEIGREMTHAVGTLRTIRMQEAAQRKYVAALDAARGQYVATGDWAAFVATQLAALKTLRDSPGR